jgi:hypothetical protein
MSRPLSASTGKACTKLWPSSWFIKLFDDPNGLTPLGLKAGFGYKMLNSLVPDSSIFCTLGVYRLKLEAILDFLALVNEFWLLTSYSVNSR